MNATSTAVRNRRLNRRQLPKGSTKASCYKGLFGLGRDIAVAVLDISQYGAQLVVKEALGPGQPIEVGLEGLGRQKPIRLPAVVIWCMEGADGNHLVGARFERSLSYADMQALARS
jgi:PilZ domain